ncbi:hypothetical protein Q5752_001363 [Cryptotrichosporon argae]
MARANRPARFEQLDEPEDGFWEDVKWVEPPEAVEKPVQDGMRNQTHSRATGVAGPSSRPHLVPPNLVLFGPPQPTTSPSSKQLSQPRHGGLTAPELAPGDTELVVAKPSRRPLGVLAEDASNAILQNYLKATDATQQGKARNSRKSYQVSLLPADQLGTQKSRHSQPTNCQCDRRKLTTHLE